MTLHNLRQDVRQEVRFHYHGLPRPEVENAELHELVENLMPVYTADLLKLAQQEQGLALEEPESLEFGGEVCPVNLLAVNLFDKLAQEAEDERHSLLEELEG